VTWAERAAGDVSLQAFVAAEIVKAGIDVQTWRVEAEHRSEVIRSLKDKIADLERDRAKPGRRSA